MAADIQTKIEITAIDNATRVFNQVGAAAQGLQKEYQSLQRVFGLAIAGFSLDRIIHETIEWEQASNRLNAVLRATGSAVGLTRRELDDLAESLARSTPFSERDLRNAETNLLKFGRIHEEVFREALKLSADYAALTGGDVTGATQAIGRALADPVNGLKALQREFGNLTFTQREYIAQLEAQGKTEEAQIVVLEILRERIAGTAEAMNTGMTKAVRDGEKAWEHMLEGAGHGLAILAGELARVGAGWQNMFRAMRGQPMQGLPAAQMAALGAPAGGAAPLSWEEQFAKQNAVLASWNARAQESFDRRSEAAAKAEPIVAEWTKLLRDQTNEERALDFVLKGQGRTLADLYKAKILNVAVELDWRRVYKDRMDLAAQYAKALHDETLGEEENLATRVKVFESAWGMGTKQVFRDYIDHARDASEQASFLFTNAFRNMEDGLVEFARTGKLDFRSFADSVVADLIRIQIRQALAGFASSSGGFFAGLGGLFGLGGASASPSAPGLADYTGHTGGVVGTDIMRTSLPMHPAFLSAVPRFHNGLAPDERLGIFQTGERIIPRGGGGPVIHQHFHIGGDVTRAEVLAVGKAAHDGAIAAIIDMKRRDPKVLT